MLGRSTALFAFVLLLVAGCASPGDDAVGQVNSADFDESRGAIEGTVTDESLFPIPGALVTLDGMDSVTTGVEGEFRFSLLPPGPHTVIASAPGFQEVATKADVVAGEVASVNLRLVTLASADAYNTVATGVGRLGCGMAFQVRPAAISQPANWCGAGTDFAYYGVPQLNDKYHVKFPISAPSPVSLTHVVYESTWQSTQAFSSGFQAYWYVEGKVSGIPRVWDFYADLGEAQGRSPLRFELDTAGVAAIADAAGPTFAEKCAVMTDCSWGAAMYPYADTLGGSYPVDFSLYVDQPFTHYVTEFVGGVPPEGYTALTDA